MDTRDTPEQAQLRQSARQLAAKFGPRTVADLDDQTRSSRLRTAAREAGWMELRDNRENGPPLASGVEVAIVAEALGAVVADVPFVGPVLAADLARRAGVSVPGALVAFAADLVAAGEATEARTAAPFYAVDAGIADLPTFLVVVPVGQHFQLARLEADDPAQANSGTDLTRTVRTLPVGARVLEVGGRLTQQDLCAWRALGLAVTTADLVGVMRGVLDITVEYAAGRRQFGVSVGSFQAVQHLLADACCLMEGARSLMMHASWAADELDPSAALEAGWIAKAFAARAALSVCETAIQVHGGIGNTWECIAHVYLRRALLDARWFGDDAGCVRDLARFRLEE